MTILSDAGYYKVAKALGLDHSWDTLKNEVANAIDQMDLSRNGQSVPAGNKGSAGRIAGIVSAAIIFVLGGVLVLKKRTAS